MSLPPKPEFPPGRHPPDHRGYGRPPPPADRYRSEREIFPPRSPPRSRYPIDSYVAPRPSDAYRAQRPSTDSYVATYDRRDDDRVRREYWDREREWRERGYPPAEPRYADAGREDWERARRGDVRERQRMPEPRRSYDKDWERREPSPPRSRRPRPRERSRERSDRVWVPRKSKSPPRRIGRPRSPSPGLARRRSRSPPTRRYSRSRSPPRRRPPTRSRSPPYRRSRSPARRSSPPPRRVTRSPSSSPRRNRSPTITPPPRHRSLTPITPVAVRKSPPPTVPSIQTSAGPSTRASPPQRRSPTPDPQPSVPPPTAQEKGKMRETSHDTDKDGDIKMGEPSPLLAVPTPLAVKELVPQQERRRSRSPPGPPTAPRNYAPTPPTPSSPHPGSSLPIKPSWSRRSTKQIETPVESPSSATQPVFPSRPKAELEDPILKALAAEIAGAQKIRLAAAEEYKTMLLQKQRTAYELQLAELDLRGAQMRRMIAEDQLERANVGELGIEYNGILASLPVDQVQTY